MTWGLSSTLSPVEGVGWGREGPDEVRARRRGGVPELVHGRDDEAPGGAEREPARPERAGGGLAAGLGAADGGDLKGAREDAAANPGWHGTHAAGGLRSGGRCCLPAGAAEAADPGERDRRQ